MNSTNKILAAFAALMTVGLIALVASTGAPAGGGGGSSAPQTAEQQSQPEADQQEQSTQDSQAGASSGDYDPSAEIHMTIDELEQEVSESTAEVGDNPRSAASSDAVPTVQEVYQQNGGRGFDNLDVLVDFDINGNYSNPHVVDSNSTDKYPCYKMLYTSSSGVVWVVYINDGLYIAVPMGTSEQPLAKEIIVTEADAVIQYDGIPNQYSDFDLSTLSDKVGVRVDRVDAQTLDAYTIEALAAM
ncbi:MAG: hypothetical protein J6D34_07220 [Atopobiaceae bacterium]|nr:hypothetical protein [Atopobiaceae bacterium]